jgi:tetratricopeptide (TPR) repeat protein/predicted Ser/Thr protein kinase
VGLVSAPQDDRSSSPASPASPAEAPTIDHRGEHRTLEDSFDEILRKVVQPAASPEVLDVGSELAGRFKIARVLGEGGMGTVYVARDAMLGRNVAIKVHHAAGGARRLRREAVAMAKLAHPNVVTVFEVGDLAGRPFVVMEYITGTTLRAWLATPRSVREILAMLIAAGEGLAAAHDAGLVHRDVKPENVLIGVDGRARVGDFGLARELDSKDEVKVAAGDSLADLRTPVTQTGTVLGTPAYMSPEQFAGAPIDARADQFAFCVTVWEALWSERPFAGTSFAQLHAAIALGTRRPAPATPKVPVRVRLALERGLSVEPADRFPTMHALLDALRPAARRRRRWIAAGGALALAGAAAVMFGRGRGEPACDTAGVAELAAVRSDLPMLMQQHGATQLAVKAEAASKQYRDSFRKDARAACEASRAHEWAPEIAAKSSVCFAITARAAALSLANLDPAKPMDVLRHLRRLPPQDQCHNQTHLASRPPAPSDPVQLAALIEAKATLTAGFDNVEDHDFAELQRSLDKLAASPAHGDPGIAAGMTVLRGWLALERGQLDQTRKLFVDAYYAGRAIDDDQISSVALGALIEHGSDLGLERPAIQDWLRTALADADRIRARSRWLAGRIYVVAAHAADVGGDAKTALLFVARAREVLEPGDPSLIDTYVTEGAVLMWSGHIDDGIKAYDTAIAQRSAYAGAEDPEVATLMSDYAASLLEVEHLDQALQAAERASQIIGHLADPNDDRIDPIRVNLAAVLIGANQDDKALGLLDTARANNVKRFGEINLAVANIDSNLAVIYNGKGDHDRAIAALKAALATNEKLIGPGCVEAADVLYNLAVSYNYKHDHPAALAAALRAAQIQGARSPGSDRHRTVLTLAASIANESGDFTQALALTATSLGFAKPAESAQTAAWAQLERARSLIGLSRSGEARPLLVSARAAYSDLKMSARVQQIDKLLSTLPERSRRVR